MLVIVKSSHENHLTIQEPIRIAADTHSVVHSFSWKIRFDITCQSPVSGYSHAISRFICFLKVAIKFRKRQLQIYTTLKRWNYKYFCLLTDPSTYLKWTVIEKLTTMYANIMDESSKFPKSWTLEIQIFKLASWMRTKINNFMFQWLIAIIWN